MRIPLLQFEQLIDPAILKRGLSYFIKGYVDPPDFMSDHDLETIVHGTEDDQVNLHVEGDVITDFVCDCPFDSGPVCKHVAAVIFFLVKDKMALDLNFAISEKNFGRRPCHYT